jgi:enamine deaminase RidA (YjgF/YER057c/UK114 family)
MSDHLNWLAIQQRLCKLRNQYMAHNGAGFRPPTIEPLHHVKRSMTMTSKAEQRLQEIGVSIPDAPTPAANYLPFTRTGNLVFVSGQVPFIDGKLSVTGTVGKDASIEDAQGQAKVCAINLLAQLKVACNGDLDRVVQVVKLGAFVASADDFHSQPVVVNAASDLMVAAFGDAGRHARFAVGSNALPLNCLVEIDGVFEIA